MRIVPFFVLLGILFLSCKNDTPIIAESEIPIDFNIPAGFELDDLYRPSAHGQGSWVALAQGPDNKIFACDQYGEIYQFLAPDEGQTLKAEEVKPLGLKIGEAHGLLWAFNSLYVAVNKSWDDSIPDENENGSGVYRITDSDANGDLDKVQMLLKLDGAGEHGPHSMVLSPDGTEIYFIAGNHTMIPESVKEHSRLPTNWGEDNLFKPYLDARGHANDIKAPGGWISKFNPEGTNWELISAGYRNPFDMAFNEDGELFAYDADMEWDIGMPWYRPTRVCLVTSGSEYGWRTGSGKWPAYFPDNLPAVLNLEQGSPTAVLSGAKLNFPAKYKNGLLIMDWSFGTVYYVHLNPKGSSYAGEREEFISGTPLPLTDMITGADGNLYFATGGRRIGSHLFRLRYTGSDKGIVENKNDGTAKNLRDLRHSIEKYHSIKSLDAIHLAWENLNHADRFIRYASRIALENQSVAQWQDQYFLEKDPEKIIEGAIALARQGDKGLQGKILDKLDPLKLESLSTEQQIALLRSYELLFIRMGAPDNNHRKTTVRKLRSYFPHVNNSVTKELGQLLLFLRADGITKDLVALLEKHAAAKTITEGVEMLSEEATQRSEQYGPLIRDVIAKMPPSESIYYGLLLSHAEEGWTKALREKYFLWFYDVLGAKGGMSFKAYMENVRQEAMTHVPVAERSYFQEISGIYDPSKSISDIPQPVGPGKNYSIEEFGNIIWGGGMTDYKGTLADGERAYKAGMCYQCHRMRGEGGAAGPDLTQAHSKFNAYEMMFALYSPNDEISDQYANTLLQTKDGKKIAGRIKLENNDSITLMPNPFNESYTVQVAKENVIKRELSPVSPMPPGLLNRLNEQEIKDLFAYLLSGGDGSDKIYSGKN